MAMMNEARAVDENQQDDEDTKARKVLGMFSVEKCSQFAEFGTYRKSSKEYSKVRKTLNKDKAAFKRVLLEHCPTLADAGPIDVMIAPGNEDELIVFAKKKSQKKSKRKVVELDFE